MRSYLFNRNVLNLKSLSSRKHDLDISTIKTINLIAEKKFNEMNTISGKIIHAHKKNAAIIMMMGAHVIRSGVQNYLIDLMERGYISTLAMNGAGIIHDFEFAMIGATTESVAHYIKKGQFGLWSETGHINDIINRAYKEAKHVGMGHAVGEAIYKSDFKYKNSSLLAAGYRLQIPVTVHVSIGQDIIHEHPNCDGAATGALSYNDFLKFASAVQNLENGVIMNFGSAVMAPEVFLKALSIARNVAHQQGDVIRHFTALVCDLHVLPSKVTQEPSKDNALYYFRPWKTMLVRTVREGGASYYIKGRHGDTIPALHNAINEKERT